MEFIAQTRNIRISPRKVRLVADALRDQSLSHALRVLAVMDKRGATALEKTIRSAAANAKFGKNLAEERLLIKSIDILEGQALKRYHASTRGRIHPYKRRASHIKVVLKEVEDGAKS